MNDNLLIITKSVYCYSHLSIFFFLNEKLLISFFVCLACLGEPPCALAAGRAVPPD